MPVTDHTVKCKQVLLSSYTQPPKIDFAQGVNYYC